MPVATCGPPWSPADNIDPKFLALVFVVNKVTHVIEYMYAFDNCDAAADCANLWRSHPEQKLVEVWSWDVSSGHYTNNALRLVYSSLDGKQWYSMSSTWAQGSRASTASYYGRAG